MSAAKDAALDHCWAVVKKPAVNERQGLPAKTWSDMPIRARAVLVMLGATSMGDPRETARRPWESLTRQDREGIAACARELRANLDNASCLF